MEKKSEKAAAKRTPVRASVVKPVVKAGKKQAAATLAQDTGNGSADEQSPVKKCGPVRNFKRHAKTEISKAFPAIVQSLVTESRGGSLGHTKLLFDIGGLKDETKSRGKSRKEPSLGTLLLEELQKRKDGEATAQTLTSESGCEANSMADGVAEERGGDCGAEQG